MALRTGALIWFLDLVFFDVSRRGRVTHVGVYMGKGSIAHASTRKGVSYAELTGKCWRPRHHGARRHLPRAPETL
ncbi:MAG: NlpC/P60 family protein [Myxococcota bacterium]